MWLTERLFKDLEPKLRMQIQYIFAETMKGECRR